jgi:hypothetical protein
MLKTFLACGFAVALLGTLAVEVSAQTSCSGYFSQCQSRCKANAANPEACISRVCRPKFATCRTSGCYQETAGFGDGANHCGLKKS